MLSSMLAIVFGGGSYSGVSSISEGMLVVYKAIIAGRETLIVWKVRSLANQFLVQHSETTSAGQLAHLERKRHHVGHLCNEVTPSESFCETSPQSLNKGSGPFLDQQWEKMCASGQAPCGSARGCQLRACETASQFSKGNEIRKVTHCSDASLMRFLRAAADGQTGFNNAAMLAMAWVVM
eukprot:644032-Pelagomonas_calceolata.AAC.1